MHEMLRKRYQPGQAGAWSKPKRSKRIEARRKLGISVSVKYKTNSVEHEGDLAFFLFDSNNMIGTIETFTGHFLARFLCRMLDVNEVL